MHLSNRTTRTVAVFAFVVVFMTGLLTALVVGSTQDIAAQVNCGSSISCPDIPPRTPDPSVRSVANITHYEDVYVNPRRVEPDTGEHYTITLKYASLDAGVDCKCQTRTYTATVEIDWDSVNDQFEITDAVGESTTPFLDIDLDCGDLTCGAGALVRGYGYSIGVDANHTVWEECPIDGWTPFYLDQVLYTTNVVDDGEFLDGDCLSDGLAEAVTQTFQVGDNGNWTCTDDGCPTQVALQIKYD